MCVALGVHLKCGIGISLAMTVRKASALFPSDVLFELSALVLLFFTSNVFCVLGLDDEQRVA